MHFFIRLLAVAPLLCSTAVSHPISKRNPFLPVPHEDPFYDAPDNLDCLRHGEIYDTRTIIPEIEYTSAKSVVQIAFRTQDTSGNASHTVATVFTPQNPDPKAKLFSLQVPEDSLNIDCSPSYSIYGGLLTPNGITLAFDPAIIVKWALSKGYYVVVTDHEGPKSAFFAGFNEGYAGIDGIRAALNHLNLSCDTPLGLYGYSGGAHATVWMLDLVSKYAPELNIVGAAHGGTLVDPEQTMRYLDGRQDSGFVVGALGGLLKAYPSYADKILSKLDEKFRKDIDLMNSNNTCILQEVALFLHTVFHTQTSLPDIYAYPPIHDLLVKESLLSNVSSHDISTPKFPRYVFHSVDDDVVPFVPVKQYVEQQCSTGGNIQFVEWTGINHLSLEIAGIPDALQFLHQAFEGKTPNVTCGTAADDVLTLTSLAVGEVIGGAIADALKALDNVMTPLGKIILNL